MSSRTVIQTVVRVLQQPTTPPTNTEIQAPIHSSNTVEAIEVVQQSSETISQLRYKKFADKHLPKQSSTTTTTTSTNISSNDTTTEIEVQLELELDTESDIEFENEIEIEMEDDITVKEPQIPNINEHNITVNETSDNEMIEEEVPKIEKVEVEEEDEVIFVCESPNIDSIVQQQQQLSDNKIQNEEQKECKQNEKLLQYPTEESVDINDDIHVKPKTKKRKKRKYVSCDILTNKILGNHNSDSSDSERYKPQAMIEAARANEESCCDSIFSCFTSCFSQRFPTIEIDDKFYKIEKLIAEGGFSFVYCAKPASKNHKQYQFSKYAIKKMIVQTSEQLRQAKWEINVMKHLQMQHKKYIKYNNNNNNNELDQKMNNFMNNNKHQQQIALQYKTDNNYIIPLLDSTIVLHKKIPEFKIVYMVFPYMVRGNLVSVLQDMYDQGNNWMDEIRIYGIFIRVCYGVYELHRHKPAWAHRDIKLDNILLGMDDEPYLMDFGSTSEAKVHVRCRNEALEVQEWAQTHMSGPYTPPEFFDCKSKFKFDVRTDVWALGCLLYAMAFGRSPFEQESGSSALAVLGGNVVYPEVHPYSDHFLSLIEWMLKLKLKERPFVPSIIERVSDVMREMKVEQ